ncbi:MAG TPA: iron-containing alcohol dehydrogenase [Aggregatilinea sp.]|uniref:iron-containing alcohol dehydrogenase n=1 Tax=Aggregatilinea sp. TaxID=2806333 RepID=UPI002CC0A435|nr:iron-containing alcohol dehydrogenase [Aggregatilinea sp.]HML24433.1 iron-containing alcohol dehydrogenase [Aggregatilinea sp.]
MTVWPLPRISFRELGSIQEKRPVALLTTEQTWAILGSQIALPLVIQAEPERVDLDLFEYLAAHLPSQVEAVYVIGQGAPLEAGKIVASRNNVPLIVVPTALESDAPYKATATVYKKDEDGQIVSQTIETGPATEVIIDWDVIKAAPDSLRGAGIVDVISIITGLLDWRYAAQRGKNPPEQRFTPWAASVAAGLAAHAIKSAPAIGEGKPAGLRTLLDLLMEITQLGNQLGHTRVQEGGEHLLAEALAAQDTHKLSHAEIVGPCILLVSALHGQDPASLRDAMESAGVKLDRLRAPDVQSFIDNLPEYVGMHALPYSILNDLDPLAEDTAQALRTAGLAILPGTWQSPDLVIEEVEEEAAAPVVQAQAEAEPAVEEAAPPDEEATRPEPTGAAAEAAIVPEQETLPEDAPREAVPNGAASDAAGDDDEAKGSSPTV